MIIINCKRQNNKRTLPPFYAKSVSIDIKNDEVKATFIEKEGYENLLDHFESVTGISKSDFLVEYVVNTDHSYMQNAVPIRQQKEIDAVFKGKPVVEETYRLLDEDAFML